MTNLVMPPDRIFISVYPDNFVQVLCNRDKMWQCSIMFYTHPSCSCKRSSGRSFSRKFL